jgi:uncharacterized damage-inducible protein DinB
MEGAMTLGEALDRPYARLERQLLEVAEAMPEERYSYRPTPEVRTFGEQLRHVAAVQWFVAANLLKEPPPVDVGDGDSGPPSLASKPDLLKYTKDSFAYIRRAVSSLHDDGALEMIPHPYDGETRIPKLSLITGYASHRWEHYGQMVVYQRLSGIVPPCSR